MISAKEIYWVAGLLEGEGYFGLRRQGRDLVIELTMTDRDVVDRLQSITGSVGTIKARNLPSGKIAYHWQITNQHQAAGWMMTVLSLLGLRRAGTVRECLTTWKAKPLRKSLWTHCKNGHELSGDNLRIYYEGKYIKRRCRSCQVVREQKYRDRLRKGGLNGDQKRCG